MLNKLLNTEDCWETTSLEISNFDKESVKSRCEDNKYVYIIEAAFQDFRRVG